MIIWSFTLACSHVVCCSSNVTNWFFSKINKCPSSLLWIKFVSFLTVCCSLLFTALTQLRFMKLTHNYYYYQQCPSFMSKTRWGKLNWLLIQSAYQDSHYLSSSLTCGLTLDLYDPGTAEVNERHTVIYLTHNSPAGLRLILLLSVWEEQLGLCRLVNNHFIVTKQCRQIEHGVPLQAPMNPGCKQSNLRIQYFTCFTYSYLWTKGFPPSWWLIW